MRDQLSPSRSVARIRADQVGSLLRPQKLKEIYARHGRGEASDAELREAQNEAIKNLLAQQETHRLSVLTDGEYRRLNFQDSFVASVSGFVSKQQTIQFQERRTLGGEALQRWQPDSAKTDPQLQYWKPIVERLRLIENQPLAEWRFAAGLTKKPIKVTLISPGRIGLGQWLARTESTWAFKLWVPSDKFRVRILIFKF
jgi:5-methyltetrahydropteroyltriglutamate--homocysteine methyltransferase